MLEEIKKLPKPILILVFMLGLIVFISLFGLWQINRLSLELTPATKQIQVIKAKNNQNKTIYIDIEGAIEKPGVYILKSGSRLINALQQAQGLTSSADRYQVAKTFNLAKRLIDEEKIYIPFLEERAVFIPESLAQSNISINNSSQTQLELLPGVGPVTAQKIMDKRPFATLEELLIKKVLGQKTYEKIAPLITL